MAKATSLQWLLSYELLHGKQGLIMPSLQIETIRGREVPAFLGLSVELRSTDAVLIACWATVHSTAQV